MSPARGDCPNRFRRVPRTPNDKLLVPVHNLHDVELVPAPVPLLSDMISAWAAFLYHNAPGMVWSAVMGGDRENVHAERLRERMTALLEQENL